MRMRVGTVEVEFACEQEDDHTCGAESGVATCFALGCLEQPVEGFEKAVAFLAGRSASALMEAESLSG